MKDKGIGKEEENKEDGQCRQIGKNEGRKKLGMQVDRNEGK